MVELRYNYTILNLGTMFYIGDGPQSRFGCCGVENNILPLPGVELISCGCSVLSLVCILTELSETFIGLKYVLYGEEFIKV
jgi:hypothetical protein